jgi:hypothetical protein
MSIWFWITLVVLFLIFSLFMCAEFTGAGFCGFLTMMAGFFLLLVGLERDIAFKDVECEYETRNIYSLTLNSKIEGDATFAFVIGYATVDEVPCYYFYEERAGGMYLNSVSGQHSVLVETDEAVPHIEMPKYKKYKNPNWLGRIWRTDKRLKSLEEGVDFYIKHRNGNGIIDWSSVKINDDYMIRIYVPAGTIKKQFVADTANL